MTLSIYNKASTDSLLSAKANLSGATFTGGVEATGLTITAGSGGVLTFADGTTQSTAGGGGGGASWGSITGSISSQTDLQTQFGNYLSLSGGTMTGALYSSYGGETATFFGGNISITDGTYTSTLIPYFFYTTNGSSTSYFTPTYIQFADGSTQTTAASAPSANQLFVDALASCFCYNASSGIYLTGMAGTLCLYSNYFTTSSSNLIALGTTLSGATTIYLSVSNLTDGTYIASSGGAGVVGSGYYLFYTPDSGTTYYQSSFPIA